MPTTPKKNWTLLVYLAGDNNLDAAGVNILEAMKAVGSSADVDVIAQFGRDWLAAHLSGVSRRP